MDDIVLPSNSTEQLQQEAEEMVQHGTKINPVINADKFSMLVWEPVGGRMVTRMTTIQVDGHKIQSSGRWDYVRFLGGDLNWFSKGHRDLQELKKVCKRVQGRMQQHTPAVAVIKAIVGGVIINKWTHRKAVKAPEDAGKWKGKGGGVARAVAAVA